jgi:H+-transporting ATPase
LVISVDNTQISDRPDKWRIGQLLTLSVILAVLLAGLSFAHWFIANNVFKVEPDVLHFVIFSTRVPGFWWENMPHWIFATCIIATQIVALFFSVYGIFGSKEHVAPCGWPWGIAVLAISLVYFMFLDVVRYSYLFLVVMENMEKEWGDKKSRAIFFFLRVTIS